MQQIEIITERLILRAVTPAIIRESFTTKSKDEIVTQFGLDEYGYNLYYDMFLNGIETYNISLYSFIVYNKLTNQPIGECGFHTWNKKHRRAEIFYKLHNDQDKQKGYMTEAATTVIDYGFNQLNIHRIAALVAKENIASIKLLLKFGFVFEGTMREDYVVNNINEDSDCYSLLKSKYKQ